VDKDFLKQHLDAGMSLPEIGRLVGRSPGTVGYWVKRHGLIANGSHKYRPGKGIRLEVLQPLVEEGLTVAQIAHELQVGVNTVSYWIAKHELPKPRQVRAGQVAERLRNGDTRTTRMCRHHGEVEFVMDRPGHWRCRICRRDAVTKRRRKVKRLLVAEAGGKCLICGYNRSVVALQFHHLDPDEKRFAIAQRGCTNGINLVREEAAKCVLLCANCHSEVEAGLVELPHINRHGDG
jgi:hypothetical protein